MSMRDDQFITFASHFEVQTHRLVAESSDINRDFQQIVQLRRMMEVAFQMNARQPHVEFVKHDAVRQANRAKQFRFGKLKEANVRAIENDAARRRRRPSARALRWCISCSGIELP